MLLCSAVAQADAESDPSIMALEKPNQAEKIQIIGKKHLDASAPVGQSVFIDIADMSPATSNLSQLVADIPGADLNGQGGLFQVFSLRGMSRWRVLTQIAGMPIHTERRAGTAASFISPWLMQQVEIIKGPVSTLYGSGAMAGITQISPRQFSGFNLQSGFADEVAFYNAGWGNEQYSFGLAHRQEQNTFTPTGDELNSQFKQTSASFSGNWALNDNIDSQLLILSSLGKDIGKANNDDFIDKKRTIYPEEKHLISQFSLISGNDWQTRFAIHKQQLDTEVTRFNKRINQVDSQATDYSFSFLQRWQSELFDGQWGFEQEYRDNIKADETQLSLTSSERIDTQVLAASVANSALFTSINYQQDNWSFGGGARLSYVRQSSALASTLASTLVSDLAADSPNENANKQSDHAVTSYASAAYQLSPEWQVTSSISSGFRFPTVSERFYHGTTGRGQTIGNPNLVAETAKNAELGLQYQTPQLSMQLSAFNNRIKHYIERIDIDENSRSYKNLHRGDIKGIEFSLSQQLTDSLSYAFSGHHLSGKNQSGARLGDISPDKLQLALKYQHNDWQANLRLKHRFSHKNVAAGEQALDSVDIVNVDFSYDLSDTWQLSLWVNNLLDKEYQLTADNKSALSAQRQVGLSLSWAMD